MTRKTECRVVVYGPLGTRATAYLDDVDDARERVGAAFRNGNVARAYGPDGEFLFGAKFVGADGEEEEP